MNGATLQRRSRRGRWFTMVGKKKLDDEDDEERNTAAYAHTHTYTHTYTHSQYIARKTACHRIELKA